MSNGVRGLASVTAPVPAGRGGAAPSDRRAPKRSAERNIHVAQDVKYDTPCPITRHVIDGDDGALQDLGRQPWRAACRRTFRCRPPPPLTAPPCPRRRRRTITTRDGHVRLSGRAPPFHRADPRLVAHRPIRSACPGRLPWYRADRPMPRGAPLVDKPITHSPLPADFATA